jgi:hypothetical protein
MSNLITEKSNASSGFNINRGGYNEGMFAYHLNGEKWIDDRHREETLHHKAQLEKHDILEPNLQHERAKAQAKSFLAHAKKMGYSGIASVHHTSKSGDILRHTGMDISQQENPSDVVVKFKKKPATAAHHFFGASLKSSSSKAIGFHNGGAGTIGRSLGVDLEGPANAKQKDFMKKNKLSSVTSKAHSQIKGERGTESYRNNPLYDKAMSHASGINKDLRDTLHDHYSKMDQNEVKHHLLKTYIKANHEHALPYVKVHGTGGGAKEASAHTEDPSDNDVYHNLRNAKNISFHKSGSTGIQVHADGKKAFGIQVKHNNGPLTPMKILGQP